MEGIFQYQKTHNEELQSESLKSALVKCFQATGITPTSSGTYKQFSFDTFKSHGNHKANAHLFKVYALQEKERIHACMLLGGFDDQDPNDWDDEECRTAGDVNIPVAILCSSDSDDEQDLSSMTTKTSSTGADLRVPAATLCSSDGSEEEDDGEDSEELDSADTGPSGECLTKRGAPVTTSGGGGKRRKK